MLTLTNCLSLIFELAVGVPTTSTATGDIEAGGTNQPLHPSVMQNQDEEGADTMQLSYVDSFKVHNSQFP